MRVDLSQENLLDRLKQSGLISAEELDRVIAVSTSLADGPQAPSLAHALVHAGVLTPYQLEAFFRGAQAELRIGNYDVLDRLGAGGMGTVFKARHRRMKRIVAIKLLSRSMAQDVAFLQRFQREVETIARLSHPNIVMAFDADEAEAGPFLVMEYVNGLDLASLLQQQGPFSVAAAVDCILQGARGLEYAHRQGIIHRDIKPANLMRDVSGIVKVTDLGLARFSCLAAGAGSSPSGSITQAGGIVGTVDYMPPEQSLDPASIDHRADIYSLGATLHFLLLGQPPYQGETLIATLLKHREAPIPSLTAARRDVPAELDAVFRRMLAKSPADRLPTMTEVVAALESVRANLADQNASPSVSAGELRSPADTTGGSPPTREYRSAPTGVWQDAGSSITPETTMVPSQADTAQTTVPSSLASSAAPFVLKVILVEPSRTQSGIIRKYLEGQGIQHVVAVASGQEALRAVRSALPDAIICAMHLPDMTGVQLAQQTRSESRGVAHDPSRRPGFVLISSEAESSEAGTLSKCGKAVLLQKPFTPEQLVAALRVVTTPAASATAQRDVHQAGKAKVALLRVLIVDDSAPARLHIRSQLEQIGVRRFVEAVDGARAVAALAKDAFDLIVTDYNMPYMDGRGLVGFLKQNPATASVPIIMVTTETDTGKLEAVRRLGVTVCDKGFPAELALKVVGQIIGE